jgi:phosphomannomutase
MKPLKIGITGVRGIVGETFTPEFVVGFAQAFGTYLDSGRILICRDTRPSGPMARAAVTAGLIAAGCEVIDLGICPTPSLQLAVKQLRSQGGISITAGHNPMPWNALKFIRNDGLYLSASQAEELLDIYHQGEFAKVSWEQIQTHLTSEDAIEHHIESLRAAFDVAAVRARRLRVAVDCCNGSCSLLSPRWLEELGCQVLAINDDPSSPFPHNPEPKPETMAQLRAVVKAGQADIGFAHDADGERLGIVSESGEPLSEEMTLALATEIRLNEKIGPVVTNLSTSQAIDTIAGRHGAEVVRTPVGQAYVSEAMIEHRAVIGGEGSGGVIVPEVQLSHDSAATLSLILQHLAQSTQGISKLVQHLPRYAMFKHNMPVEPSRIYSVLQGLRDEVAGENRVVYDLTDGIKVSWPEGWVHVRASNTESMIRIIAEAEDPLRARDLLDWARDRLTLARTGR